MTAKEFSVSVLVMMTGAVTCCGLKILKAVMRPVNHFMLTGRQLKTGPTVVTRKALTCFRSLWTKKNISKEKSVRSLFQAAKAAALLYPSKTAQVSFSRNGWNHNRDKQRSHSIRMSR